MKKENPLALSVKFFSVIIIMWFIAGKMCSCKPDYSAQQNVLGGKHELRKINVKTSASQSSSAWYFLVMGGYETESSTNSTVRFYFLNYKGEYQPMELPLTQVNIKIDSTVKNPYVKFYWIERERREDQFQTMYRNDVTRVVIYCKDSDFQPEININNLK